MTRKDLDNDKSCGPQLLHDGEPTNEWGVEELGLYARMQHRRIIDGEKLLTPSYWQLGHALVLAKKAFDHGQWARYLEDLGIDKTRACKARAIHRTFAQVDDVAGLTVEQAYAQRKSQKPAKPDKDAASAAKSKKDARRLRQSVSVIVKRTEEVIHDAAFASREEAVILLPAIRRAVGQLQEVLGFLEEQAGVQPADMKAGKVESKRDRVRPAK
ncbi:MAG: hypothetical protein U9N87_04540 [Planctomycetota bacterium]|nr:hypothetical protein [Planctomycetota bacterium]